MSSPCPCRGCVAAYKVGYDEGYAEGVKDRRTAVADARALGYREGYNDHAESRAYAEAVYGPYVQHGKGENP